jgi:hypothetical protein
VHWRDQQLIDSLAVTTDYDAPNVATVRFEDIRDPRITNVVQTLLRRLNDQVLCLTLARCPGPISQPHRTFVDIVSDLPGLDPGPGYRYAVVGPARVGRDWRERTPAGEPTIYIAPYVQNMMQLDDFTECANVPSYGWGLVEEDAKDEHDESHKDGDDLEAQDTRSDASCQEDAEHGHEDQFLLIVHSR